MARTMGQYPTTVAQQPSPLIPMSMFTTGRGLRRRHAALSCPCHQSLVPGLDSFGAVNVVRAVLFDHLCIPIRCLAQRLTLYYHGPSSDYHICGWYRGFLPLSRLSPDVLSPINRCFHKLHIGHRSQQVRRVSVRAFLSRSTHWAPSCSILSCHHNLKAPSTFPYPKVLALLFRLPRHDTLHSNHLRDAIRTQG